MRVSIKNIRIQIGGLFCLVVCFFLFSCSTKKITRFNPYKKYGPQQLQQDFDILQKILEAEHPSLYWYASKETINEAFANGRSKLTDSLSELQYKRILSEVVAAIQCGHTSVRSSKKMDKWLAVAKPSLFPFGMRVYQDSLVATYNLYGKDTLLKRGTVIKSINGFTSKQIIDSVFKAMSTDGISNNFKNIRLSGNFPFHYAQSFDTTKYYSIIYEDSLGNEKTLRTAIYRVPPRDTSKKRTLPKNIVVQTKKAVRAIKLLNIRRIQYDTANQTAILTINSFSGGKQKRFYRKTFKEIKKSGFNNLVIDVRNNGGGLISNSTALAKYIRKDRLKIADTVFAKIKFSAYNRYIKYRFWYGLSMVLFTKKKKDGNYHFGYFERHYDKPKKQSHFNGNIYVITGGYSFSATSLLIHAIKGQNNVITVGEETGGGAYGNSAVYIPDITLPNTKIRVRLPVFRLVMDKNRVKNGRGFFPDIYVPPTVTSIKLNWDNKMEKVMELIKKK